MPLKASARSQVDRPFTFTLPYSVTSQWRLVRVAVMMVPSAMVGRMRDFSWPVFLSI